MARTQQEWEAIVGGGYTGTLGRTPDASEINHWVNTAMNSGLNDQELINAFNNAAAIEIASRTPASGPGPAPAIALSGPGPAPAMAPSGPGPSPAQTFTSTQAPTDPTTPPLVPTRSNAELEATVRGAYQTGLGRTPDQLEVNYWVGLANSGLSDQEIVNAFNNSAQAELADRGASIDIKDAIYEPLEMQKPAREQQQSATSDPEAGWDEAILDAYDGILGRTPGQDEIKYWKGVARSGVTGNDLLNAFQNAAQTELKEREYEQLVLDQYANIGRTDIGDELSNVGQGEIKYWVDQLASGAITPENFEPSFVNAVADFVSNNPDNEYSQYVSNYLQENDPRFQGIAQLYEETLGRKADPQGLVSWYSQFGTDISDEERTAFLQAAAPERFQNLYESVLNREGTPEEIQAWVDAGVDPYRLEETFKEAAAPEVKRNTLPSVVAGITEDNMISSAEAFDLKSFANEFDLTPEQIAEISGVDKDVIDQIFGKADTSISGVINAAQTAFASEDQAGVKNNTGYLINLLDTGVVSYKDLADQSGGVWTEQGVRDYVEPLRTFSSDFAAMSDKPNLTSDEIR